MNGGSEIRIVEKVGDIAPTYHLFQRRILHLNRILNRPEANLSAMPAVRTFEAESIL